jgi:hypothetical protein
MPVLPYITDKKENIIEIVRKAKKANSQYILIAPGVTLRDGQREYFYTQLQKINPELKKIYEEKAGKDYSFSPINVKELTSVFYSECEKLKLPVKMKFYEEPVNEQLKLF